MSKTKTVMAGNPGMSAQGARNLTDRIKTAVEVVWELVSEAYRNRAWEVLGYASWDEYCVREFGTSRIRIPREERGEIVTSLRENGMSVRAITSATGLARNTVRKEVGQIDPPAEVVGLDGKTYQRPTVEVVDEGREEAAWIAKEKREQEEREAAEREGRTLEFSAMFKAIRNLARWGKYEDTPWVMKDFNPAELSPTDLYKVADDAEHAARFIKEFIEWRDGEHTVTEGEQLRAEKSVVDEMGVVETVPAQEPDLPIPSWSEKVMVFAADPTAEPFEPETVELGGWTIRAEPAEVVDEGHITATVFTPDGEVWFDYYRLAPEGGAQGALGWLRRSVLTVALLERYGFERGEDCVFRRGAIRTNAISADGELRYVVVDCGSAGAAQLESGTDEWKILSAIAVAETAQ